MSEKELFNDLAGETFKESTGIPANAHAKKKAKEKSDAQKSSNKLEKIFFTIKDGKILKIKVKPNGAYSDYVGKKSKLTKDAFEANLKKWKADGQWLSEDDYQDKVSEVQKELADKFNSLKK